MSFPPPSQSDSVSTFDIKVELDRLYRKDAPLNEKPTHRADKMLRAFVGARPELTIDVGYLGEVEVKLAIMHDIQKICEPYHEMCPQLALPTFWSLLLTYDVGRLRDLHQEMLNGEDPENPQRYDYLLLELGAQHLPGMLKLFTQGWLKQGDKEADADPRDGEMSRLVLLRDSSRCVITNTRNPQVCHIFPFAALNRAQVVWDHLKQMRAYLPPGGTLWEKLIRRPGNIVDTMSNMICMSLLMHKWWGDGRFMLEPYGEPYKEHTIKDEPDPDRRQTRGIGFLWVQKLKLRWLKRTHIKLDSQVPMSLDTDPRDHWDESQTVGIEACNIETWRPVEDGQIIKIYAKKKEELPDREILDFQVQMLKILSMAGGADPVDLKFHDDEDDNIGGAQAKARVEVEVDVLSPAEPAREAMAEVPGTSTATIPHHGSSSSQIGARTQTGDEPGPSTRSVGTGAKQTGAGTNMPLTDLEEGVAEATRKL